MEERISQPRPTFYQVLSKHNTQLLDLARASRQPMLVIWDMVRGQPVSLENAIQVLGGLNEINKTKLTLADVQITLERKVGEDERGKHTDGNE